MNFLNWTTFRWLSDESFIWRDGEFLDCSDIDLHNNSQYITWNKNRWTLTTASTSITWCRDGIYPVFFWTSNAYIGFGLTSCLDKVAWQIYARSVEQIGTSGLPVTYWFQNSKITQQTYNGTSFPFNDDITLNVPTGNKDATCIWAWRIYFSVANIIYILDTAVTDPTTTLSQVKATSANNKIPFWYTIKYMYIYMDIMNVVTTDWKDTIIYQLSETTTDVWNIRYYHRIKWNVCISAIWDGNTIYWITKDSIFKSNWIESIKVKKIPGWGSPFQNGFCTFYDGIFKICINSSGAIYEYWHNLPWRNDILVRQTSMLPTAIDWDIIAMNNGGNNYVTRISSNYQQYPSTFTITSLPYYANDIISKKEWTYIRVSHMLPAYSTYSNTTTLCSITVWVITDEMEQKWLTSYVTIATITTPTTGISERFTDIETNEIISAITTAWHNPDFHYIKIKITWNNGDQISASWYWTVYNKSPIFYWLRLIHNEVKKWT